MKLKKRKTLKKISSRHKVKKIFKIFCKEETRNVQVKEHVIVHLTLCHHCKRKTKNNFISLNNQNKTGTLCFNKKKN